MPRNPEPIMPDKDEDFDATPQDIQTEEADEIIDTDDNPDSIENDIKILEAEESGKPTPVKKESTPETQDEQEPQPQAETKPEPTDAELLDHLLQKNPTMVKAKFDQYNASFNAVPVEARPKPVASWDQVPTEVKDTLESNGLTAWAKNVHDRQDRIDDRFHQVEASEIFTDAVEKQAHLRSYANGELGRVFTGDDVVQVQTAATLEIGRAHV